MSHFTVLVIGENVDEQLAPFHEFECTGKDDQYVQDIDQTEEARKEYETHTETKYKDLAGKLHDPYEDRFYRELTPEELKEHGLVLGTGGNGHLSWTSKDWDDGKGYRAKAHFLPEGWEEVKINVSSVKTFAQFVKDWYEKKMVPEGKSPDLKKHHKYGYAVHKNGEVLKVIDRTNPNAKWDWYKMGGRWNGFFKLKSGLTGATGEPGLNKMDDDYKPPAPDRADCCMKGDIDIEGMRNEAGQKAEERYDKFTVATVGCPRHLSWEEIQKRNRKTKKNGLGRAIHLDQDDDELDDAKDIDWDAARKEYHEQPAVKALHESKDPDVHWYEPDNFLCTREEYVARARKNAIATFAVVKDSQWHERGEMGWWGAVSNEKDQDEWINQFSELIDSLPDNALLTIVDCHI